VEPAARTAPPGRLPVEPAESRRCWFAATRIPRVPWGRAGPAGSRARRYRQAVAVAYHLDSGSRPAPCNRPLPLFARSTPLPLQVPAAAMYRMEGYGSPPRRAWVPSLRPSAGNGHPAHCITENLTLGVIVPSAVILTEAGRPGPQRGTPCGLGIAMSWPLGWAPGTGRGAARSAGRSWTLSAWPPATTASTPSPCSEGANEWRCVDGRRGPDATTRSSRRRCWWPGRPPATSARSVSSPSSPSWARSWSSTSISASTRPPASSSSRPA
jgi:hypothetical protein